MGDKDFDNFNLQIGEIIGKTLDGRDIYKFTELGTAKNVMFGESIFKDGDFVVNEFGSILILKETRDGFVFDHAYLPACGELTIDKVAGYGGIERHATEEEKQKMLDALAKKGKRWNAEKLCVEDIPAELKKGDLAIFWDNVSRHYASVRIFGHLTVRGYCDISGVRWDNAIKFEGKEQFERLIKGEI